MATVNFHLNCLQIDDAISFFVGMQLGLKRLEINDFTQRMVEAIADLETQIIAIIGNDEYSKKANELKLRTYGIYPGPNIKVKTDC